MIVGYILAGLGVGAAVGLTGVGGGSLMTPLLILGFGLAPSTAIGTDLLYAAVTKGFGTLLHGRQRSVDWPVVGLMAAGSVPAALVTIFVLSRVGMQPWVETTMTLTLGCAILVTACLSLLRARLARGKKAAGADAVLVPPAVMRRRAQVTVAGGALLGVLVTLSSVGAGVLGTTMLLLLYPRFDMVRIVGTDITHAVPLALIAGLGHLTIGTARPGILVLLLIGSLPGIFIGTRIAAKTPDHWLRALISVLLVVAAGSMFYHAL